MVLDPRARLSYSAGLEDRRLGLGRFLRSWLNTAPRRDLARAEGLVRRIEKRGTALRVASDEQLRELAAALHGRARAGEPTAALLVDTFALVREVAGRTTGLRPYDVQLLGGLVLRRGRVVEMKTGEGKTLVATLPVVLHALAGRGVHVVTVNDYLAARDAAWMGPIYDFMGLTVGVVTEDLDPDERLAARQRAYAADITYVTNHELVFDHLRDNLATDPKELLLRPLNYALVDEVDLLLLDEARTPLIISGPSGDDPGLCTDASRIAARLTPGRHYKVDHRTRRVLMQEAGWTAMERAIGVRNLADPEHRDWQHTLHNAMLAHAVYERDVDYIVDDDHVYLIDEHTGRVSLDKRFSDGLHQALEAKEGVTVRGEDRTLAKTSYQMFFAQYPLLAGMSGTAYSARAEFQRTYGLRVVVVPTHQPVIRRDLPALAFRSAAEKFAAATAEIEQLREASRPVLVGTTSVRESEQLAALLAERGVGHQVLNAKNHQREAAIIAQAGRPQAVTLSTNMAGRGVDIKLGGSAELDPAEAGPEAAAEEARSLERAAERVRAAGGLAVLGTGLHEARRIDDQLRGRAGRQGDPGSSRYFISLDDPVYKRFGEIDPGSRVLERLRRRLRGHPANTPIGDRAVLGLLEQLRRKVEVENEAARKEVLKYDVVAEQQRRTIYTWRRGLLTAEPAATGRELRSLPDEIAVDLHHRHFAGETQFDRELYEALADEVAARFDIELDLGAMDDARGWSPDRMLAEITDRVRRRLDDAAASLGEEAFAELGRQLLLATIDALWTEHLTTLERLDEGIGLRAYGHLDPLVEFRREANLLYQDTLREIRLATTGALCRIEGMQDDEPIEPATLHPAAARPIRRTLKN